MLRKLFRLAFISMVLLAGCREEELSPTPYIKQGFIKVKITGKSMDDTYTFNDSFVLKYHTHYLSSVSGYDDQDGIYTINFGRMDIKTGSYVTIMINNISDLENATPPEHTISVWYLKPLSNTTAVGFGMSSDDGNSSSITDFSFNPETGIVKGKFSLSGSENSTGKNASVTGEFSGKVFRYFY